MAQDEKKMHLTGKDLWGPDDGFEKGANSVEFQERKCVELGRMPQTAALVYSAPSLENMRKMGGP